MIRLRWVVLFLALAGITACDTTSYDPTAQSGYSTPTGPGLSVYGTYHNNIN